MRPKGAEKADTSETVGNKSSWFFLRTSDGEVALSKKLMHLERMVSDKVKVLSVARRPISRQVMNRILLIRKWSITDLSNPGFSNIIGIHFLSSD